MKKIMISIFLVFVAISGFAQATKQVKLDSVVSISFPAGYQEKDTLNQQTFTANGMYGYMIVIRQANEKNNTPLKQKKDLNKVLKDMVRDIQAQSAGSAAMNVRDTTVGTLTAKTFSLRTDDGYGDFGYRNFVLLYTQDATYTFEYAFPGNRAALVKDDYKAFVSSIRIAPGIQRNNQYLSNAGGLSTGLQIAIFGGGALLIILVIVLIVKRRNRLALS